MLQRGRCCTNQEESNIKLYSDFTVNTVKAYEEIIDFIAAGTTPQI
jgi:hypothetical protein